MPATLKTTPATAVRGRSAPFVRLLALCRLLLLLLPCLPLGAEAAGTGTPVKLEPAQRRWLEAHGQWRVGTVLRAPYAQIDGRQGNLYGANVELMEQLAAALNVRLQWQTFQTQEALESALDAGSIDLTPGLGQTPAGLRRWLFSDPYLRVSYLVVGERNGLGTLDLETLRLQEPLAVDVPEAVRDYLRSSYPNLRLEAVGSPQEALQRVLSRQAKYAVLDESQLGQVAREAELAELAIVGDIGMPQLLRVASRRDWPQLAVIVDAGLQAIPAKTLDQLHRRWLQQPSHARVEQTLGFWRSVGLLLGLLSLICLALLFSLRRQRGLLEEKLLAARREVELRDAAMEELRLAKFSIDHSTVGTLWINWDSRVRYANHMAERMLGYLPNQMIDRPLSDLEPSLSMERWHGLWKRVRSGDGGPLGFETEYRRADGSQLPAEVSLGFLRYGEAEYLVVFLGDITERRRALAALQESEAQLQSIAANVPGLVFRLERQSPGSPVEFAFIGEGSEGLVGYPAAVLLQPGFGLLNLVHADDRVHYQRTQALAFDGCHDWHWQGRFVTRSGEQRWVDIKATARCPADGEVVWDGIVWDISANKRAELALAESRAQLRELSAHLESVREEEKAHIAREVHDELGQVLTGLKLETSMCELSYASLDPGLRERLGNMKRQIAQLFQLVRDVASALRPPILDAGLASAIEWQARRFEERTQIPCLLEVPENLPALADGKAVGLFRILQEALTNIARHAQAHTVELRLEVEGESLCLTIGDDGRGFAVNGERPRSFGLVGMHERALMLNGTLAIDSRPGEGTTLTVRVPLNNPSPLAEAG